MTNQSIENRVSELLADQILFGLDPAERRELDELKVFADDSDQSFETAAAVVELSMNIREPLPKSLELKLSRRGRAAIVSGEREADRFEVGNWSSAGETQTDSDPSDRWSHQVSAELDENSGSESQVSQSKQRTFGIREVFAWACAASVGFLSLWMWIDGRELATFFEADLAKLRQDNDLLRSAASDTSKANNQLELEVRQLLTLQSSLMKEKSQLLGDVERLSSKVTGLEQQLSPDGRKLYESLSQRDGIIKWTWSPTEDSLSRASGDVVWDQGSQTGAMRFVNLESTVPEGKQYQLWIIEAEGGRKHPVDGGVFTAVNDGEIYIPIDAKLLTYRPKAFAITVEPREGVVVSDQSDLRLLAKAAPTNESVQK